MTKKNVIFVRHAESEANAGLPTTSPSSVPLSSKGHKQALALAENFPIEPELIVLSKYIRTHETATPLISKLKNAKVETWDMVHEFTFLDREKYKNTTTHYRRQFAVAYWEKQDPFYKDGPHEENFIDLLQRAEKLFEIIKERNENNIAIFSHGQFITALKIVKKLNKKTDEMSAAELKDLMHIFIDLNTENPIQNTEIVTLENLAY